MKLMFWHDAFELMVTLTLDPTFRVLGALKALEPPDVAIERAPFPTGVALTARVAVQEPDPHIPTKLVSVIENGVASQTV